MRKQFLLLMLALLPLAASADAVLIGDLYYNLKTEGGVNVAEVTANPSGYTGDIVIPPTVTYDDVEYSVTSIGKSAFYDCKTLTSVTIPNSVTSIETASFGNCPYLTSITIPNSVTNIGESAFWMCKRLTTITIPNSVTSIGEKAFQHCEGLTSVTIGNGVTSIGEKAFQHCDDLTSIACYAEGVPVTGENAFGFCNNVTALYVPSSSVDAYSGTAPWSGFNVKSGQVEVGGIYYQLNPVGNVAEVIKNPDEYTGNIVIPSK